MTSRGRGCAALMALYYVRFPVCCWRVTTIVELWLGKMLCCRAIFSGEIPTSQCWRSFCAKR